MRIRRPCPARGQHTVSRLPGSWRRPIDSNRLDKLWGADAYWEPGPFLGDLVIFRMVRSGVRVVGVDFPVSERSQETRLIATGKIAIVENLRDLASLPRVGLRFSAIPSENLPGAICAVRAFAEII